MNVSRHSITPSNSGDSTGNLRNMEVGGSASGDSKNEDDDEHRKGHSPRLSHTRNFLSYFQCMNSTRLIVLTILCLQNSMFTVLRRYSQGVLREVYSKVRYPNWFASLLLNLRLACRRSIHISRNSFFEQFNLKITLDVEILA